MNIKRNNIIVPLCKKREYSKLHYAKVDEQIAPLVMMLNLMGVETKGCCCGHNKYKSSIIINLKGRNVELFSKKVILRKKRFYRKKGSYYYVPELENEPKKNNVMEVKK